MTHLNWRSLLTRFFLLTSLLVGMTLQVEAAKPNFVVILTDDQGYADVGCFGSPDIRTPRLDAMAAEGMKFTSFYAQPVCGPSRAALMTGCYPMRVAERGNTKQVHPILHSDEITIAEILQTYGYATACFGKWDLAKHAQDGFFMDLFPTRQGFDYFFGTPTSNDRVVNLYRNEELIEPKTEMASLTGRYTDEAIRFMKKHHEQPFFVYIPHTMPHTKLDATPQFKGKSQRGLYGDVIEEIDFNVGRVLDAIGELGLAEQTYVIFTSDNGPWLIKNKEFVDGYRPRDHGGSAGPLRSGKVSTFEGGVRVPCIVWGPGRVPAGKTCDSIASTLDVLPTLAALAGSAAPRDRVIDGEDIRHLIHGEFERASPDKAYFYYLRVHLQAVRQGPWKLHLPRDEEPSGAAPFSKNTHIALSDRIGFAEPFLVDLEHDIGETTNVAEKHPQITRKLLDLAESMRADLGDFDRVGKNMRFFDLDGPRPTEPPVPERSEPTKSDALVAKFREDALQRWMPAIDALEKRDRSEIDPTNAVLFIGSSSIRRWESIATDMAPFSVIQRGYGGAKYSDLAVFIEGLVEPHDCAAVAIFVGNDIAGKEDDKTPEEALLLVKYVANKILEKKADTPVFFIAVTPNSSRFHVWNKVSTFNRLVSEYCQSEQRLHFIDTADKYLDEAGKPIDAYFVEDKLHLNQAGYQVWSERIKEQLSKVIKPQT